MREIIGLVPRSRFLAHPRHHRHHRYGAAEFLGILGSLFFLVAFLIPIGNYVRYRSFRQQIINSGHVLVGADGARISIAKGKVVKATDKRLAFAKDASFHQWELDDADKDKKSNELDDAKQTKKSNEMAKNLKKMHPVDVVHKQLTQADPDSTDSGSHSVENAAYNPRSEGGIPRSQSGIEIVNEDADSGGKITGKIAWGIADKKKIHVSCGVNYAR